MPKFRIFFHAAIPFLLVSVVLAACQDKVYAVRVALASKVIVGSNQSKELFLWMGHLAYIAVFTANSSQSNTCSQGKN